MSIVELDRVTYRRGDVVVLHDVSWRIEAGRHCALLGANGAGKTTLLKIVTGYEWPTSGTVHVLGRRFGECNLPELRKALGWVSSALEHRLPMQDTALDIVASGIDSTLGVYRAFSDEETSRAHEALEAMRAHGLASRAYGTLSQGEQQRVLIARALAARPALLILDEPCLGLDPAARYRLLHDLESMTNGPTAPTLVFVTHHIEEIGPWIRAATIMKNGSIVASGAPADVLTSAMLGSAFSAPCRVERIDGAYRLQIRKEA